MTKGTPGPWVADQHYDGVWHISGYYIREVAEQPPEQPAGAATPQESPQAGAAGGSKALKD